jgi:hypothetical protein
MSLTELMKHGFEKVGVWQLKETQLVYVICEDKEDILNAKKILYAFVIGKEVKYIGKTYRTFKERMSGYANPGDSQKTNLDKNSKIKAELRKKREVLIYAFYNQGLLIEGAKEVNRYGAIPFNLAAGLEDGFIEMFEPDWNVTNRRKKLYQNSETEDIESKLPEFNQEEYIIGGKKLNKSGQLIIPAVYREIIDIANIDIRIGDNIENFNITQDYRISCRQLLEQHDIDPQNFTLKLIDRNTLEISN